MSSADLARGDGLAIDSALRATSRGISPATLLEIVKGLVARGTPALGAAMLRSLGAPLLADPAIRQLATQLAAMRSRTMPRDAQRSHEAANRRALEAVGIAVPDTALALVDDDMVDVVVDVAGLAHPIVRIATDDDPGVPMPAAALRFRLTDDERAMIAKAWPPFVGLVGLPSAHLLAELLAVENGRHVAPAYVAFESDARAILGWLRCADHGAAIRSGRLRVSLGVAAVERHVAAMRETTAIPPIRSLVVLRPDSGLAGACRLLPERTAEAWSAASAALAGRAQARVAARLPDDLVRVYRAVRRGEGKLRVAGIVQRHTKVVRGMMVELLAAFEALGHETTAITEPEAMPLVDRSRPFADRDFDLVVAVNYLRAHPDRFVPVELPFVSWMQDGVSFAMDRAAGRAQSATDLLVAASPGFWETNFGYPPGQSVQAANLTSWRTYGRIGDSVREAGAPDVVYVGHGWESAELVGRSRCASPVAATIVAGFVGECRARLARGEYPPGFERMRILAGEIARHGVHVGDNGQGLYWTCQTAFDRLVRHEALEWAAAWARARRRRFAIYGAGWEKHPTLASFAAGEIENGEPLGRLCRDAAVTLHANGNASLHQRLLDGFAAGGLVLTRWNPADEMPRHARALAARAESEGWRSVADLEAATLSDAAVREERDALERTLGCWLRPTGDARRTNDVEVIRRTAFWPAETQHDDGLLRQLCGHGGLMTTEGAADIDGFERTVYRSRDELFTLLDRVTSNTEARDDLRTATRECVRRRFTMESLASRIVGAMTGLVLRGTA
jgi:hypothetical protein